MCIIALTTKGKLVKKEKLLNMTKNNSHGFGISWIENGKVKTFKSMDSKKFIERAIDIQSEFYNDSEILIHCRIATSGKTNINNCHPFPVDNDTVFAHNGMFDDEISGCTYPEATNYNPDANDDDGSCEYMWGDVNHDGLINVADVVAVVNLILSGDWL